MKIIIYAPQITPRTRYVMKQVFGVFLEAPYELLDQEPVSSRENDFVVHYATDKGNSHLHIQPCGLLEEQGTKHPLPGLTGEGISAGIFPNTSQLFGFDVFAAIFWMLSRYEEYGTFNADRHGRFPASASFAYQQGFLEYPVVDQWVNRLREYIDHKKPGLIPAGCFKMINTVDVDNAFAYKGKGFWRQSGALAKHLLRGEFSILAERIRVLRDKTPDPYDNYAYIRSIAERYQTETVFFHLSGKLAPHDRNISLNGKTYRRLLSELNTWSVQGVHPSYASGKQTGLILEEKQALETAAGRGVDHSRQHFIRLWLPLTYRELIGAGIRYDFSMGFADHTGFRAGTGKAFYFFDLEANEETSLLVQPFCIMEGTLKDYMGLSPLEATGKIKEMKKMLTRLGSTYVAIWHNETLGNNGPWKGWRAVFESQFLPADVAPDKTE